jgi:hypothetical protein
VRRLVLIAGLVTAVLCGGAAPAGAATWSVVPVTATPTSTSQASLLSVSCASASACATVGDYQTPDAVYHPVIDQWDGVSFTSPSPPLPAGATSARLESVSCPTATTCMAVGLYSTSGASNTTPFADAWAGGHWLLVPVPGVGALLGVSCTSPTMCVAVGSTATSGGQAQAFEWNGQSFSPVVIPPALLDEDSELQSVSCSTPVDCTAVGLADYFNTTILRAPVAIAERLSVFGWTLSTAPLVSGTIANTLTSVSCPQPTACVAGGTSSYYYSAPRAQIIDGPLIAGFGGGGWSDVASPVSIEGVDCLSVSACTGVGFGPSGPVASEWDGSALTTDPLPAGYALSAVSCLAPSACVGVGGQIGFVNGGTSGIIEVSAPSAQSATARSAGLARRMRAAQSRARSTLSLSRARRPSH